MAMYQQLLTRAQGVANTPYEAYTGDLVAPVNAQQQLGISNINTAMPIFQQAADTATTPISHAQINYYRDPYTQQVVDATQAQFNNQNAQARQQLLGSAAAQNALGGNRIGVAEAQLANQQQLAQAPVIADLMSKGWLTGLNAAQNQQQMGVQGGLAAGQGILGAAGAQIGAGTLQQQTDQAKLASDYQQWMNAKAYPFQTTQWLAGIGTGVGSQMGGTSTGTQTSPGPSGLSQILGGASAGLGMLGASGAFGSAGWMAPLLAGLARGGRVRNRAAGGGVAFPDDVVPETSETLMAQQGQLLDGDRAVQMFPQGTAELGLPEGMGRFENERGAFHYNPEQIGVANIAQASAQGRENEILDLGPYSKEDIFQLIQQGGRPLVAVERTPDGVEVRAAIGTEETLPAQIKAMESAKSPNNTIVVNDLVSVLNERAQGVGLAAPGRASGGAMEQSQGVAPYPYAGGAVWVPTLAIQAGSGAPRPIAPTPQREESGPDTGGLAKGLAGLASSFGRNKFGDRIIPNSESSFGGAGASASADNPSMYARGGAVGLSEPEDMSSVVQNLYGVSELPEALIPQTKDYAFGGGVDSFDDRFGAANEAITSGVFDPQGSNYYDPEWPRYASPPKPTPWVPLDSAPNGVVPTPRERPQSPPWPQNDPEVAQVALRAERPSLPSNASSYGDGEPTGVANQDYGGEQEFSSQARDEGQPIGVDWSERGKLWPSLIAAGFGMMASKSPHAGVAIGEGGLHGARTYEALRAGEENRGLSQQRINLEAQRLQQAANIEAQRRRDADRPYREMTAYQKEALKHREKPESEKIKEQTAARREEIKNMGLDPNNPIYQAYILTGKMPREDAQPLTATDKKAILEADEMVELNKTAISNLEKALELSPKAFYGPLSKQSGEVGSWFGHEKSTITADLNNLVMGNALGQLKAIFGAAPTEGERKILLEIQGSVSQPPAVRDEIYKRALVIARRRLEFNRKRAEELRGGTYYKPKPGAATTLPEKPTLQQFIEAARKDKANDSYSDDQLAEYYNKKYNGPQ